MKNKISRYIATVIFILALILLIVIAIKPTPPEFDGSKYEKIELPRNSEIEYYEYMIKQHEGAEE